MWLLTILSAIFIANMAVAVMGRGKTFFHYALAITIMLWPVVFACFMFGLEEGKFPFRVILRDSVYLSVAGGLFLSLFTKLLDVLHD